MQKASPTQGKRGLFSTGVYFFIIIGLFLFYGHA